MFGTDEFTPRARVITCAFNGADVAVATNTVRSA